MSRRHLKLPSLSRVAAGSKATLEMPIGPTFFNTVFSVTGTGLAVTDIEGITVLIDGKEVQKYSNLQRLVDFNNYYNRSADTIAEFMLHFFRAEMADAIYRRASGIGTADVATFHIELDIAAGAPVDIAIVAHAYVNPERQPLGTFLKLREYPFNSAVSGQVEISNLPRKAWYTALHLFKADISAVEVEVDSVKQIDATKAIMERQQKEATPIRRIPMTAKATTIDFLTEGDAQQSLATGAAYDFRVKMTLDTAGAVDVVAETIDTLEGV